MSEELKQLKLFCEAANNSNSSLAKLEVIRQFPQCQRLWQYAYDKIKYQYGVKSANIIKNEKSLSNQLATFSDIVSIYDLLDALATKQITGHNAIKAILGFIELNPEYKELIYNIIDRNLKTRTDAKLFNKVYPGCISQFDVALANDIDEYDPDKRKLDFLKDIWYASRKLDGIRNATRIPRQEEMKFFSRNGKEFWTLGVLKREIQKVKDDGISLDGELCIVDSHGNENFTEITKHYRRKNYTIPNPRYCIFDLIDLVSFDNLEGPVTFEERQRQLTNFISRYNALTPGHKYLVQVEQIRVRSWEHLEELKQKSVDLGWEGLILRKNVPYEGTRSNNMLKVKLFKDAEFVVKDVEMGMIRYIAYDLNDKAYEKEEMMLSAIMIEYMGNVVRVGSGFSHEERKQYYQNPNDIIGRQVTVKYFQTSETSDKDGTNKKSLRFPTLKKIWADGETREDEE